MPCDHWRKNAALNNINVEFNLAGAALFGVATFVPPLMKYIEKYNAQLAFNSNLVKVDGPAKTAWFEVKDANGNVTREAKPSICCTSCRRKSRRISSPRARWPTPPAGARSIRTACSIRVTP